jgi:hypothetical protein
MAKELKGITITRTYKPNPEAMVRALQIILDMPKPKHEAPAPAGKIEPTPR